MPGINAVPYNISGPRGTVVLGWESTHGANEKKEVQKTAHQKNESTPGIEPLSSDAQGVKATVLTTRFLTS